MTSQPISSLHIDPQSNLPVYAQIRQQVTWMIASGSLKPGDRLPTIRDLAKRIGIHMHTVRQAYHALEADGLVETRPKRGTLVTSSDILQIVHGGPRPIRHVIGVLVPSRNPFYAPYLQGIEDVARRTDDLLLTCYTLFDKELPERYTRQLLTFGVDGIIATSLASPLLSAGALPPASLPPIIHVDDPQQKQNSIAIDNEGAAHAITTHLIQHKYKRIGLITCPLTWQNVRDCFDGYCRALAEAGIEFDPGLVHEIPFFTPECGYQGAQYFLEQPSPPRAVFAVADILAVGAVQAIKSAGWRIPEDIAIAGYNNIEVAALMEPPLTTASVATYEMGVEAMSMLNRLRNQDAVKIRKVTIKSELVIRRSCGCVK